MKCACGKSATTVLDYTLPGQHTVRVVVCDDCGDEVAQLLVGGMASFDIVLRGDDIRALDAKPCWCDSKRHGLILASGCPMHGMVR
jgi:hypothetical protein